MILGFTLEQIIVRWMALNMAIMIYVRFIQVVQIKFENYEYLANEPHWFWEVLTIFIFPFAWIHERLLEKVMKDWGLAVLIEEYPEKAEKYLKLNKLLEEDLPKEEDEP